MKVNYQRIYRLGVMGILLVGFCLGCASINQKIEDWQLELKEKLSSENDSTAEDSDAVASATEPSEFIVHTVQQRGETLPIIAEWYTKKSVNWKALLKANPRINPQRIKIGSQVKIPENLLVTRKPMSPEFVNEHLPAYYKHTICWAGETLSLISKWYTGKYTNWQKIANHNPEIDPRCIKIGQTIYIPDKMLRTRKALPQKFAAQGLPDYFAYTVQQAGESLAEISRRFTGDSNNWKAIAQANPDVDPKYLLVGNEIYIPSEFLKSRATIENDGDDVLHENPESQDLPAEPAASPKKKKDIQLFGPKQFPSS